MRPLCSNTQPVKLKPLWTASLLVLVTMVTSARSEVVMGEDGGYRNLVVRISDSLDMNKCADIIQGVKSLLTQTSSSLHTALQGRAHLASATILVPSSWPSGVCGARNLASSSSSSGADTRHTDIMITTSSTFHGYHPHTQQSGGCGVPGEQIHVPATWLTTNNVTVREARVLVHLWAKYRYGILDDTGYSGDPLYPSFYRREGGLVPSLAHNGVLTGTWLRNGEECDPSTRPDTAAPDCVFVPDNARSEGVTCSLGNGLGLSQTTRYCNSSETWPAPTKHAVVCGGRAAAEIIAAHPDFRGPSMSPRSATVPEPEITVTRAPSTRYVLALETSARMAATRHWAWVRKAAHRFIRASLPVSSSLAVLTFARAAVRLEHAMVAVTSDQVRTVLADTIPGRYHLEDTEDAAADSLAVSADSVASVLDTVASLTPDLAGLHVILVTTAAASSPDQQRRVEDSLASSSIKLSTIIVPSQTTRPHQNYEATAFYDAISQQSGGRSFKLAETGYGIDLLVGLNQAFSQVLRAEAPRLEAGEIAETVHMSEHYSNNNNNSEDNESAGAFVIDESLGRDTIFGIYVQDEEDHLIKSVTFRDSDGNTYGPFTKMSSALDPFNIKTINYVGEEPPFGNARWVGRQWRYRIQWSEAAPRVTKNIVTVTSKPRTRDTGGVVGVAVWTHPRTAHAQPVAVFARVSLGSSPVLGATVYLDVEVENSNGTVFVLLPEVMVDNGHGEPDMTGNDGVYSCYIPSYPSDGRYKVTVRVSTDSDTAATFPQGEIVTRAPCCGRHTNYSPDTSIPALTFARAAPGPVLHLANTADIAAVAPHRVTDLAVAADSSGRGQLRATWSRGPGTDAVSSFKFVFSAELGDLLSSAAHPQVLREVTAAEVAEVGEGLLATQLQFSLYGRDYYLAVVAVARDGRHSRVSNIAHVYQQPPPVPDSELAEATHAQYDLLAPVTSRDWIMVAVVCAIFAVLLAVTLAMTAYLCWYKHKRARGKMSSSGPGSGSSSDVAVVSSGSSDQTDATSFDLDMKNLCPSSTSPGDTPPPGYEQYAPHHLAPHHVSRHVPASSRDVTCDSVTSRDVAGSGSRVTPIYWSASQLLSKLDTEAAHAHYSPGPGLYPRHGDAVIPEEFCVTVSDLHSCHPQPQHRTYSDSSLGFSDCDMRDTKMPPPVFPKPKNITQV